MATEPMAIRGNLILVTASPNAGRLAIVIDARGSYGYSVRAFVFETSEVVDLAQGQWVHQPDDPAYPWSGA